MKNCNFILKENLKKRRNYCNLLIDHVLFLIIATAEDLLQTIQQL